MTKKGSNDTIGAGTGGAASGQLQADLPSTAGGLSSDPASGDTMPLKASTKKVSYSSLDAMSNEASALKTGNGGIRLAQRDSAVDLSDRVTDETRLRCRRIILIRHVLAAMAERMFEFAIMVLLTVVGPGNSFGLIAAYGITVNLMVALFSPGLGAKLDRADRLKSVMVVTVVQNICTATCAAILLLLLYTRLGPTQWLWYGLVCLIFLFAALNHLFYGIAAVTLERDWVVVIADEEQEWLRVITANLRQIDLCTDLVAPSLVSLLAMVSYEAVAIFISVANVCMVMLQYSAFHQIYAWVPRLDKALYPCALSPRLSHDDSAELLHATSEGEDTLGRQQPSSAKSGGLLRPVYEMCDHARVYSRQVAFLPGVATAMLYLTVLSFHIVMVSYLLMRGLHVGLIGLGQGLGSGAGVLGAMAYERVAARTGTLMSAAIGIWWQVGFLFVAMAFLFYPDLVNTLLGSFESYRLDDDLSLPLFLLAVIISRFGLFLYEVAVVQIFQLMVEEGERNVVAGFQRTLESVFELTSFVLVLCLPKPSQFPLQAAVSSAMVLGAALLYTLWTTRLYALLRRRRDDDGTVDTEGEEGTINGGVGELKPSKLLYQRLETIMSVGSVIDRSNYYSIADDDILSP